MIVEDRLSPNCWNVGHTVKVGRIIFRAHTVYPDVLFEVVDDAEDCDGVPESSCEGAV